MKKVILQTSLILSLGLSGCAHDTASIGPDGQDSTLSDNSIEGLYLLKFNYNQNTINITSHGDTEVKL